MFDPQNSQLFFLFFLFPFFFFLLCKSGYLITLRFPTIHQWVGRTGSLIAFLSLCKRKTSALYLADQVRVFSTINGWEYWTKTYLLPLDRAQLFAVQEVKIRRCFSFTRSFTFQVFLLSRVI